MTPEEFWDIWHQSEPDYRPTQYRLYYNDLGWPIEYTNDAKPGNYINVTPEIFVTQPRGARVVNNQLVIVDLAKQTRKLIPNNTGTSCDSRNVCVIIEQEPCTKWSLKTYDPD